MARRKSTAQPAPAPDLSRVMPPRDGPAFQGENALTENEALAKLEALLPPEGDNSEAESASADDPETLEPEAQDTPETEATASDDDLIIEEDGEEPEAEGPPVYEVPWDDGTVQQLTAEEIRSGYLRRSDYDRKQAERARAEEAAAQAKQSFEAKATALDGMLAELSRLKETGLPQPPNPELAREDPAEYIARKADYDAKMAVVRQAEDEATKEREQQIRQAQEANAKALLTAMPAWQDVSRQTADLAEMRHYGVSNGWWSGEVFDQSVASTPHWILTAVHKARLYDAAVARRNGKTNGAAPVTKRVTKVQPTVKTQASQPQSSKGRVQEQNAWQRFRDNPSGAGANERAVEALLATVERKGARHRRAR